MINYKTSHTATARKLPLEISSEFSESSHVKSKNSNKLRGYFLLRALRNDQKKTGKEKRTVDWRLDEGAAVSGTKRGATEHDKIAE
jgi:hypothetical protein